ncbi:TPA: site-specific integrase [Klebsiella pneumoniae]|nr:site-specific integrase [Klebsiella pneumoniae]
MGNSKRNIKKLNDNFREDILDYAISHNLKCAKAIIVLYATGCRPDEILTGIRVNFDKENNQLLFKIIGSKLNAEQKRGIRIREVTVKITEKNNKYYNQLIDIFKNNPGAYDVKIKIGNKVSLSNTVKRISETLWPRKKHHASPYSFRHAKATELKNAKFDEEAIAKIMGHASIRSQQSYGRRSNRSSGEFDDITNVETSSKPRGGDRLLRFKIANKNKAAAKIEAGFTTPSNEVLPPKPQNRFKKR